MVEKGAKPSRRRAAVAVAIMLGLLVVAIGVSRLVSADREAIVAGGSSDTSPPSVASASVGTTTTAAATTTVPPSTEAPVATTAPAVTEPIDPPPVLREEHPPLRDIDGWLQSDVTSLEELRGKVVIVEFWTFGCYNCRNRLPYTQDIYAAYRDQGLEIVGIHSPEFAYEKEVDAIVDAMDRLGVTWPVVLDTDRRTFREWQGSPAYWPRTYVLDRTGRVRFDHIGEGAYGALEDTVVALLAEAP
ncbi:MAG: redoxin domain-containing protein [Acidimicrobiia bacterium]|nr:redoxin domain-containing protein [Acidimicrobiia bacterium]